MGFLPWEIWVAFSRESQLWQSHSTQPKVHAGCFSVSTIHWTLTWTTGSLTCAQMLMHVIAHRVYGWTHVRESELKVASGRKSLPAPGNQIASAAWRSDALTKWPTSPPKLFFFLSFFFLCVHMASYINCFVSVFVIDIYVKNTDYTKKKRVSKMQVND